MPPASSQPAFRLHRGDVGDAYADWPTPSLIISDGGYGIRGFHGDTTTAHELADWYEPHIKEWSAAATPATTLVFWNTEVGWATVHPLLVASGWDYVQLITWDKGIEHVAGNVNGQTIRQFPVVTEVCAIYERRLTFTIDGFEVPAKVWLRHEWQRSGLPLYKSNEACGVKNAATRKYLTQDWLWYFPPGEALAAMAAYANEHGKPTDRPYFSLDGATLPTAEQWNELRRPWTHQHALTNVWRRPPLNDKERLKGSLRRAAPRVYKPGKQASTHLNQKPLEFMERLVRAASLPGQDVWEPFGGLATGGVAAVALGRRAYVAEMDPDFADIAQGRLEDAVTNANPDAEEDAAREDGETLAH